MTNISLKTLIEGGAHFGHQTKRWNPKMEPYLYGDKEGVHIFDLIKTKELLEEALDFIKKISKDNKTILFVGTKKQVKDKVKEVAESTNCYYINERWLGGILTNFAQIKKTTGKLSELKQGFESGEFKDRTKKERLLLDREMQRLEKFFGGLSGMSQIPDVLVIIDIKRESTALKEASSKGLTTVAIVDSNCDPTDVDYLIPMNDDATRAVDYVMDLFKEAIIEGRSVKPKKENKDSDKKDTKKTSTKKGFSGKEKKND